MMTNLRDVDSVVNFGNEKIQKIQKIGDIDVVIKNKDGVKNNFTITDVGYMDDLVCNLISLPKLMKNVYMIKKKKDFLFFFKDNLEIYCHLIIKSGNSYLMGLEISQRLNHYTMITKTELQKNLGNPNMRKEE